jgi:hypothetical protein
MCVVYLYRNKQVEIMEDTFIGNEVGEDAIVKETARSNDYANYNAYLKLTQLDYTHEQAADHMSLTSKELENIIDKFDPGTE